MPEICENCGTKIGNLEQPFIWNNRVVCAGCYPRLARVAFPGLLVSTLIAIAIVASVGTAFLLWRPWRSQPAQLAVPHGPTTPPGVQSTDLPPDTRFYLRFESQNADPKNPASPTDLSSFQNHIVARNLQTVTVPPVGATAVFGPDTWVTVADDPSLRPLHAITVGATVRVDSTQTGPIVSKDDWEDHATNGYTLRLINNKPDFTVGVNGWKELLASEPISPGAWHYLAGTYDGQTLRLYVDGTEVARKSVSGQITPSFFPLELGVATFAHDRRFIGEIADVLVCGEALSAETIAGIASPKIISPARASATDRPDSRGKPAGEG